MLYFRDSVSGRSVQKIKKTNLNRIKLYTRIINYEIQITQDLSSKNPSH